MSAMFERLCSAAMAGTKGDLITSTMICRFSESPITLWCDVQAPDSPRPSEDCMGSIAMHFQLGLGDEG